MQARPRAREAGLVRQRVGDELVVYDVTVQEAHALGPVATAVWEACDGHRSADAIADELGLGHELVARALAELEREELLEAPSPGPLSLSRREAVGRFAGVAGVAAAGSLIYTAGIGPAVAAASACLATGQAIPAGSVTACSAYSQYGSYNDTFGIIAKTICCTGYCADDSGTYICSGGGLLPPGNTTTHPNCTPAGSNTTVPQNCCGTSKCATQVGPLCLVYTCS